MTEQDQTPAPEPTAAEKKAAAAAAKKAAAAAAKEAQAAAEAADAQAAAEAEAQRLAQEAADKAAAADADPGVGVFVGYGATCHGTEGAMYAVDPDTGLTTGPYVPEDDEH